MTQFDVIVIGGGHAGTEAAAAAARRGARVALLTLRRDRIGAMSCNPAIGGIGKGHLVREIDAFDGLMARAADAAAIHYRMLNRSKGVAVRGPRIQADRRRYARAVRDMIAAETAITVLEGEAAALAIDSGRFQGIILADGSVLGARSLVIATGTFLGGRIYRGDERSDGGRDGERAATRLSRQLRDLALPIARMKTGTPPRIDGRTIDWGVLAVQPSDVERWRMSPMGTTRRLPQVACAITRTTAHTHDIIRANLERSPMFNGAIEAGGPRYCPSIEDKVVRFGDRDGHQVFLEPESLDDHLVYPNGISTSLPTDVQQAMVSTIPGLADCRITVPGYAVEYDYLDPRALDERLALPEIEGVFCAGQINGTTGYEEAAGQGLIAGLNAAAHACDRAPVVLDRASSYLGVMIDDLTLQGVTEPYRMLTARAEYRLSLRADNAETRLSPMAIAAGCVSEGRRRHIERRDQTKREIVAARESGGDVACFDVDLVSEIVEDARYAPYVVRQAGDVDARRRSAAASLPRTLAYGDIPGLSNEMVERLSAARPATLDAAARVRGVSPAALSAILLHVKRLAA